MRGAGRQMRRYPLRSTLVVAVAALGVAGAVAAVNYASGGRAQVLEQIRRLGTNSIVVNAQQSRNVGGRTRTGQLVTTLRDEDYQALLREVEGLVRSSPVVQSAQRLKAGDLSKVAPVTGVAPDFFAIKSWAVEEGAVFDTDEVRRSTRVALVGSSVARDLFGTESPVGARLFINRVPFEVVGLLRERGQGLDQTNEDQHVYVPYTTATRRLLNIDYYSAILFEVAQSSARDRIVGEMTGVLRVRHGSSDLRPDDFKVQSQKDLIDTQISSSNRLGFLVRWVALSGLFVSGIGVLAIAWIAVRDRTREIGTRRAVGATAQDIFFQFAFEASVLATAGAATGLLVGWGASRLIAAQARLPFIFEGGNAALAFATALVLNLLFASWPALRAARMDPIHALKHE